MDFFRGFLPAAVTPLDSHGNLNTNSFVPPKDF
jgi:hypothetical protein